MRNVYVFLTFILTTNALPLPYFSKTTTLNYRGLEAPHLLQLPRLAQFQLPQEHSQSPTLGSMPGGSRLPLPSVVHPPPTHMHGACTARVCAWCMHACTVALLVAQHRQDACGGREGGGGCLRGVQN